MKKLALTVLLALLVALTAVSLRRAVAGTVATGDNPVLLAIGTDPVPPLPPPKPKNPKPSSAAWLLAIGTDPVPPLPPPKPKN